MVITFNMLNNVAKMSGVQHFLGDMTNKKIPLLRKLDVCKSVVLT